MRMKKCCGSLLASVQFRLCVAGALLLLWAAREVHSAKTNFAYSGSVATYTKPAGYNAVRFWMWGGGGGGGCCWYTTDRTLYPARDGGGGGYMSGVIFGLASVSVDLKLEVGGRGYVGGNPGAWPDGGVMSVVPRNGKGGGGGGSSRIYLASANNPNDPLVVAGGGGGGSGFIKLTSYSKTCGVAGGGCLQMRTGKSEEAIDGTCRVGGQGGAMSTRAGGTSSRSFTGMGGGGYRGGSAGGVDGANGGSGGGGLSYYNEATVRLEGSACGDRAKRPGGYNSAEYPGGSVGYGGQRNSYPSDQSSSACRDARAGVAGYVILEPTNDCGPLTYNAATGHCECPNEGTYNDDFTCVPCRECPSGQWASGGLCGWDDYWACMYKHIRYSLHSLPSWQRILSR
eukprot:3940576-Rhodomonas_salina.1